MNKVIIQLIILIVIQGCSTNDTKLNKRNVNDSANLRRDIQNTDSIPQITNSKETDFYTYNSILLRSVKDDIIFCDTFLFEDYIIVAKSISKDSCIQLMANSKTITYHNAYHYKSRDEVLGKMAERPNDSSLVVYFKNGTSDTLIDKKPYHIDGSGSAIFRYVNYISRFDWHVITTGESSFIIRTAPNQNMKARLSSGFTLDTINRKLFSFYSPGLDIGSFELYDCHTDSISSIISYYQGYDRDYYWGIQAAYWINEQTLAVILNRYFKGEGDKDSYAILSIKRNGY